MPCGGAVCTVLAPPAGAAPAPEGVSPTGAGSRSRIAAMSEAWLRPSNARRPVNIS